MATRERRVEMLQLLVLLLLDGLFYFLVIPAGIVDPPSFGMDDGLPPSFSARLVATLAGVLMLGRLAQLLAGGGGGLGPGSDSPAPGMDSEERVAISARSVAGMGAALIFAAVLVPKLGFFSGGAILLPVLLGIMGERRPAQLVVYPVLVLLARMALRVLRVRLGLMVLLRVWLHIMKQP